MCFLRKYSWWRAQPTEQFACLAHFSDKFAMQHPRPLKHYTKSEYLISICISKWSGFPVIQLATKISSFFVWFNLLATQVNCLLASLLLSIYSSFLRFHQAVLLFAPPEDLSSRLFYETKVVSTSKRWTKVHTSRPVTASKHKVHMWCWEIFSHVWI